MINLIGGPVNPECERVIKKEETKMNITGYYHEGVLFDYVNITTSKNPFHDLLKKVESKIWRCDGLYVCGADIRVCK